MQKKQFSDLEIKNSDLGKVSAVFATFGVVDKDGDLTVPGAFEEGAQVVISAYGHKSWEGQLPVGVGTIRTDGKQAIFDGKFFLDTIAGRDTFNALKGMQEAGVPSQWSYGFDVLDSEPGTKDGARRILKKMKVYEVSPVLLGAGVDTRTLSVKSEGLSDSLVGEGPSFADELEATAIALEAKAASAERVVALRSEAGKTISKSNRERIERIVEIAKRFEALIAEPAADETETEGPKSDESAELKSALETEYLRFIKLTS